MFVSRSLLYTTQQLAFQKEGDKISKSPVTRRQITCDKEAEEEDKEVDNKDGCLEIGKLFAKLNGFICQQTKNNWAKDGNGKLISP